MFRLDSEPTEPTGPGFCNDKHIRKTLYRVYYYHTTTTEEEAALIQVCVNSVTHMCVCDVFV